MPRDRIELSTPGFSDQCSTTELPRHYIHIIPKFWRFFKFGLSKADFRLRTCGALRRPQDVRHAQLAALPNLKFENRVYNNGLECEVAVFQIRIFLFTVYCAL